MNPAGRRTTLRRPFFLRKQHTGLPATRVSRDQRFHATVAGEDEGIPRNLDRRIPGVFWITCFGPEYVEQIERTRFRNLNEYGLEEDTAGGILLVATQAYEESRGPRSKRLRKSIQRKLGARHFRSPPFGKRAFPKLRSARYAGVAEYPGSRNRHSGPKWVFLSRGVFATSKPGVLRPPLDLASKADGNIMAVHCQKSARTLAAPRQKVLRRLA